VDKKALTKDTIILIIMAFIFIILIIAVKNIGTRILG